MAVVTGQLLLYCSEPRNRTTYGLDELGHFLVVYTSFTSIHSHLFVYFVAGSSDTSRSSAP